MAKRQQLGSVLEQAAKAGPAAAVIGGTVTTGLNMPGELVSLLKAAAMLAKGDMEGAAVWQRIVRAVEEMRAEPSPVQARRCTSRRQRETGPDVASVTVS